MNKTFPYEDIIDLPPHISEKHPQPTMLERAARFAPFAAITGYEEMVLEEARVTQAKTELDENTLAILNEKLNLLRDALPLDQQVRITYFEPDLKKAGGTYKKINGVMKRIEDLERFVLMTDGRKIPIDDISEIESEIFDSI